MAGGELHRDGGFGDEDDQINHLQLYDFLSEILAKGGPLELYGCWDGEFSETPAGHAVLPLSRLREPDFHFRERFHYTLVKAP